jgi:hypothetical protein
MDDFLGLAQDATKLPTQRAILHSIDSVFRAEKHAEDPLNRTSVISLKKLQQGDGTWSTKKMVLGWLLDTAAKTLALPPHKADRLTTLITTYMGLHRTSKRKWQQLLGELRHMAQAIPGARYLFSILQHLLVDQPTSPRLRLGRLVKQSLQDWAHLAADLARVPTPIQSLVPNPPSFVGAVDASAAGLGGFWIPTPYYKDACHPIIFRLPFTPEIQSHLVTDSNPSGNITNSDLELAALVYGAALLRTTFTKSHATLQCASDNIPAVSWLIKGSTSSTAARAYVLRWFANLTRSLHFTLLPVFAAGTTNTLADFCSRSFHLSDQAFREAISSQFPISGGWTIVPPPRGLASNLISALSGTMLPWESLDLDHLLHATPGLCGNPSAVPLPSTHTQQTCLTRSQFFKSLLTATDKAKYLPASLRCAAAQWATPFEPWARRWPTWDSPIQG